MSLYAVAGRPLDPRNDASQTATRVLAKEHSTNYWLGHIKVIMLDCLSGHRGSIPLRVAKIYAPFVYRLGLKVFILARAVRLRYGVPVS